MKRRSRPDSGFAYLLALLVVLILSMTALALGRGVSQHLRANQGTLARAQCEQAALGMIRAVANDLEVSRKADGSARLLTVHPEGERIGDCVVMLIGRDPAAGKVAFGMVPEAGKLNVNTTDVLHLADLPGMTIPLAGAIADWRDDDDEVGPLGGAERNDYAGEAVPYAPRNAVLESLDELRLVRGMTDAVFFGEDANQNGVLDPGEDADGNGKPTPGLCDLLTLDSREPALAPDGAAKVNVTNRGRAMQDLLTARLGQERADALMKRLRPAPPAPPRAIANRIDFLAALELTDEEAAKLWPYLSGPEGRVGLLDAYACREETLVALVGEASAERIMAARPATPPASPAWLAEALEAAELVDVGGLLTSGSYQFTLDVLAVRVDGAGYARLQAVVDASGTVVRVGGIRPAEAQGWPLPWITPDRLRDAPAGSDPVALLSSAPR